MADIVTPQRDLDKVTTACDLAQVKFSSNHDKDRPPYCFNKVTPPCDIAEVIPSHDLEKVNLRCDRAGHNDLVKVTVRPSPHRH